MIYLLIGYMFLYVHRPFEVWPILAAIHLERLYMLVMLAVWALGGEKRWPSNPLNIALAAFTMAVLVCFAASDWSGTPKAQLIVENYLKVLVFYMVLITTVRDERDLKRLIWGFVLVMGVYMAHSLREFRNGRYVYRMGIIRMMAISTTEGDPNSFAATIAYALPLVKPLWMTASSRRVRWLLAGYVALAVVCIGLTGSRSGLVLLAICTACVVLTGRRKVRMALLAVVLAPLLWSLLPPSLQNRFTTLINPEVGPANAQESAEGRIEGFFTGLDLWSRYPLTGCGPGAWIPATGSPIESHNLYGQVVGEMGTLGALTFAGILLAYWINIRWASHCYREHPEWGKDFLHYLIRAIGLGVLLMFIGGASGHNLFRYSWSWYGGFVIIARQCIEQRLADPGWDHPHGDDSDGENPGELHWTYMHV